MADEISFKVLVDLRREKGFSQQEVAEFFGLKPGYGRHTIINWESGKIRPADKHREKFIEYLAEKLELKSDPEFMLEIWKLLCEKWGWRELQPAEIDRYLNGATPEKIDWASMNRDELLEKLNSRNPGTASQAIQTLSNGVLDGKYPVDVLKAASQHWYWLVRKVAIETIITMIEPPDDLAILSEFRNTSYHVSQRLIRANLILGLSNGKYSHDQLLVICEFLNNLAKAPKVTEVSRKKDLKLRAEVENILKGVPQTKFRSTIANNQKIDFLVVTALPEEREAVLSKLSNYQKLPPLASDNQIYYRADIETEFADHKTGVYHLVVFSLSGMGRVQAATSTTSAINTWHPRYTLLVGIAGGIASRGINLGDILISNQVVDYELQKITPSGPEVRWEVHRAEARLLNVCNNLTNEDWLTCINKKRPGRGKPEQHIGPIASGDKVIAFRDALIKYQDVWSKLLGVEMEAGGVATAVFQSVNHPGFFMVRGVSDLADENKDTNEISKWRSYACDVAASYTIALLKNGPVPLSEG